MMTPGRTRRSHAKPRAASGKAASKALGNAVVKYHCAGWVPHSALLHFETKARGA